MDSSVELFKRYKMQYQASHAGWFHASKKAVLGWGTRNEDIAKQSQTVSFVLVALRNANVQQKFKLHNIHLSASDRRPWAIVLSWHKVSRLTCPVRITRLLTMEWRSQRSWIFINNRISSDELLVFSDFLFEVLLLCGDFSYPDRSSLNPGFSCAGQWAEDSKPV